MTDNVSHVGETDQTPLVNVPNALTVLRLVLVPVLIWFLVSEAPSNQWWALLVFCVAAGTDHLDGNIARSKGLVTNFGKIADPIADKALTLGAFIVLSVIGSLTWWFTVLVAVRELGITVLRALLLRRGIVVAANSGGKLKTVCQMLLIVFLIIPWNTFIGSGMGLSVLTIIVWIVGIAALALTLWSGWVYVQEAWRLVRKESNFSKS